MALSYEDARAVCAAASDAEFDLAPYNGSPTDAAYLKNWVLNEITAIYGVSASVFDTATLYSTSILRDFVNRAVYQNSGATEIGVISAEGGLVAPQTEDVATAFRYPAYSSCALLAWQEYQVFNALGYKTQNLSFVNGDWGSGTTESYNDSHTSTEVYCVDLGKSIIQDATFNFVFEDENGQPLSWLEACAAARDGTLQFDRFDAYTYWQQTHTVDTGPEPANIIQTFLDNYFKVPALWANDGEAPGADGSIYRMFPDWPNAHIAGSDQGGTYSSAQAAWVDISSLVNKGLNWNRVADQLNDTHYVSGFRVDQTEWLTVRLSSGDYISIDMHSGQVLNGSYDQIMNDATGNDRDLNPGVDLSFMLHPADLLSYKAAVMDSWVNPETSPGILTLRNDTTGALKLWSPDSWIGAAQSLPTADKAYTLEDRGDYDGDGQADLLFMNHTNGQVGYWDEQQAWHRLDALSTVWQAQSHTGTSDFYSDGADDILWRNMSTGELVSWDMLDGHKIAYQSYGVTGLAWKVIGTADFNDDGTDDILWRNSDTGEVRDWLMQNGKVMANNYVDHVAISTKWDIVGLGDLTKDGSSDILWHNETSGQVLYWNIVDGKVTASQSLDYLGQNWSVVAIIDSTHDGTDDIIWRNANNGALVTWQMHDGVQTAVASGSTDWHIV